MMKSAAGHLGRRLGCSVCRGVHTCYLNCSPLDAQFHQLDCAYRSIMPHSHRVGGMYLLPPPPHRGSFLPSSRDQHLLLRRADTRWIASPVTQQLPEFESADNVLKTFFPLGQKKNKSSDNKSTNLRHLERLSRLVISLHRNPSLAGEVWKVGLVPKLIEFSRCSVPEFERQARMALSLVGYAPPYSGRGLRILSVDGGGTRLVVHVGDYTATVQTSPSCRAYCL